MIDSIYYVVNIACVVYLFNWAVKVDNETDED